MEDKLAFERFILRSNHPKSLKYGLQLAEYESKLLFGTETEVDLESLRTSLIAMYEELKDQVPQEV